MAGPDLAYDVGAHWAAQKALFGPKLGYTAFFYPPPALLICLPLALAALFLVARGVAGGDRLRVLFASCAASCLGLDPLTLMGVPGVVDERRARPERFPQRGFDRRRTSRQSPQARASGRSLRRDGVQAAFGFGAAFRAYLRPPLDDVGLAAAAAAGGMCSFVAGSRSARLAGSAFLADFSVGPIRAGAKPRWE